MTLLTSDTFLPGSLVLLHSLQAQFKKQESETSTDSSDQIKRDFVVLVLDQVSVHSRQLLMDHGALVHEIVGIASPWPDRLRTERQLYNFSKLRLWELVHYEKVVFLGGVDMRISLCQWSVVSAQSHNRAGRITYCILAV